MKWFGFILVVLLFSSCAYKNSTEETNKYSDQLKKDSFNYKGTYKWSFDLMGGKQTSTHTLYSDSIQYKMTGKVYSTNYTIKKLSFEKKENKWIGEDESGIVYVLFFKDKTDSTLTIYKHKCKTNGLEEALNFGLPTPNATDDHGWNIYALNGNDTEDTLPISGSFVNLENENKVVISDSILTFDEKKVKKISFHSGERRWVGKYQNQYLQLFFYRLNIEDTIQLSINWFDDLEQLYNTKYSSTNNWENYAKQ